VVDNAGNRPTPPGSGCAWVAPGAVGQPPGDPYLTIRALSAYSCIGIRTLRSYLEDSPGRPGGPLPHYRVGGKVLVRRSEFDVWIAAYRRVGTRPDLDQIAADAVRDLRQRRGIQTVAS